MVRVTCFSSINVRAVIYSVPSRLIGTKLTLHLYYDQIIGYLGRQPVLTLARVHVPGGNAIRRARSIDCRHLVESLRRKPRSFLHCTWQQDLLPNENGAICGVDCAPRAILTAVFASWSKRSIAARRKKAAWDHAYLIKLLTQ